MIEQLSPINNDSALTCACQDLHKLITKINSLCTELQAINSSIFQIETEDEELKQKMLERRRTVEEVSEVIDRLSIPGELVISINSKRISDEFEAALPALNEKVQYCRKAISNGVLCANDVWTAISTINTFYTKTITNMLENQDTDLHIYRASHFEKRLASLEFLRQQSPQCISSIIKQYTSASILLHEQKLGKFVSSLKDLLLEEPLVLIGDTTPSRRKRSLLKRFDSLDLFVGKSAATLSRRPSDNDTKLPLSYILPRLFDYLQTVIDEEEVFLGKMVPDVSERAVALGALLVPLQKAAESAITILIEPVYNLNTLEQCKLNLQSSNQKRLEALRAAALGAVNNKFEFVILEQCESIRCFKTAEDLETCTRRLRFLEMIPKQLEKSFDSAVDDYINRSKHDLNAIAVGLKSTNSAFPDASDRLRHLAMIYVLKEWADLEPVLSKPITTADCTADSVNILVNRFNDDHSEWFTRFQLHLLQYFTNEQDILALILDAFKTVIQETHESIETACSLLDKEQVDSLIPTATVMAHFEKHLAFCNKQE